MGDSGGVPGYTLYEKGESPMDPVKTGALIRTLEPQKPRKAEEHQRLHAEPVENE